MIRILPVVLLLAGPATAQSLPGFTGSWQGEGTLVLGDEPAQRFRCRLVLRETHTGETLFQGRCATAQASQSFTYMLREDAQGGVSGENRAAVEDDLPARLTGRTGPGLLRLEGGEGALFEMRRTGAEVHFALEGQDSRGPARGEAVLQLRD